MHSIFPNGPCSHSWGLQDLHTKNKTLAFKPESHRRTFILRMVFFIVSRVEPAMCLNREAPAHAHLAFLAIRGRDNPSEDLLSQALPHSDLEIFR